MHEPKEFKKTRKYRYLSSNSRFFSPTEVIHKHYKNELETIKHMGKCKDIDPKTINPEKIQKNDRQYVALTYARLKRERGLMHRYLEKMLRKRSWTPKMLSTCLEIIDEVKHYKKKEIK